MFSVLLRGHSAQRTYSLATQKEGYMRLLKRLAFVLVTVLGLVSIGYADPITGNGSGGGSITTLP